MDSSTVPALLDRQAGVVSRAQLLGCGLDDNDIRRLVRNRRLARVHPGVFVNHTGPLTWTSRAWAAVLYSWPAALSHASAVNRSGDVIHVAIDASRTAAGRSGMRVHRLVDLESRVLWNLGPPAQRTEDALLCMCASARSRTDALALLADACQRHRTTPERLLKKLAGRKRMTRGAWLRSALIDLEAGGRSALELSYLRRVERAHGLPRAARQRRERTDDGIVYRDVRYDSYRLVVELDGRVGHQLSVERWDDMDRDLLAAADSVLTLRLGWRHAEDRSCSTAERLARVLGARGWDGSPKPCGPTCALTVESPSRGAEIPHRRGPARGWSARTPLTQMRTHLTWMRPPPAT